MPQDPDAASQTTTTLNNIPVVVFAGSSTKDRKKWSSDPNYEGKAHVPIAGQPMMQWVVDVINDTNLTIKIIIGEWIRRDKVEKACLFLKGADKLTDNIWKVIDYLGHKDKKTLFVSCDIPAMTRSGLRDFTTRAIIADVDVAIPFISASKCQKAFPGSRSTSFWVSGQKVTMGNVMLVRPQALLDSKNLIEGAIANKKNVKALASMAGFVFIARFLLAQITFGSCLSFKDIEQLIARQFNIQVKAIISHDPGLGLDGDSPETCRILSDHLERTVQ